MRTLKNGLIHGWIQNVKRLLGDGGNVEGAWFKDVGNWGSVLGGFILPWPYLLLCFAFCPL
jgi:hypothetical protein